MNAKTSSCRVVEKFWEIKARLLRFYESRGPIEVKLVERNGNWIIEVRTLAEPALAVHKCLDLVKELVEEDSGIEFKIQGGILEYTH